MPKPDEHTGSAELAALLKVVGDDRELLGEVLEAFLEECPEIMDAIRAAIRQGDAAGLRRATHKLKGSLRSLRIKPAADYAEQLETSAAAANPPFVDERLSALEREIDRVTLTFRELLSTINADGDGCAPRPRG